MLFTILGHDFGKWSWSQAGDTSNEASIVQNQSANGRSHLSSLFAHGSRVLDTCNSKEFVKHGIMWNVLVIFGGCGWCRCFKGFCGVLGVVVGQSVVNVGTGNYCVNEIFHSGLAAEGVREGGREGEKPEKEEKRRRD